MALFVCLKKKAIHLSLFAQSCTAALTRLCFRRDAPARFYSGHGLNFEGNWKKRQVQINWKKRQSKEVRKKLEKKAIQRRQSKGNPRKKSMSNAEDEIRNKWTMIPHFGGL